MTTPLRKVKVGSATISPGSVKQRRRPWVRAVLAITLVVGGVAAWRFWPRGPDPDPMRLELLCAAWGELDAGRYDRAIALIDRRAAEAAPTPLDWMLRARVAEARGRPEEALGYLKHIPDTDPIAAQAWLKAGQIELTRHRAGRRRRPINTRWRSTPTRSSRIASWPTSTPSSTGRRSAMPSSGRWTGS